jgi:hypothetical protein
MLTSRRISLALGATFLIALLASACAQAAPITVNLRVEGSTTTLYEGPVTTEARTIEAPEYISKGMYGPTQLHPCDVNENGEYPAGSFGASYGTPTSALYDAAQSLGLTFDAYWDQPYKDFFVNGIGSDETEDWGYAVGYTTASVGGCQFQLAPGSEVLWSATFAAASHLLELSGPATANAGSPITLHVVDGQTGAPIAGAAIGEDVAGVTTTIPGSPLTNAEGNATVTLAHTGTVKLKATQPESVRSNAIGVCVHNGNDGTCGTQVVTYACATSLDVPSCGGPLVVAPPQVADTAVAGGVKPGHVYSRRHAPRILSGVVKVPESGTLKDVRISLQRRAGKRCTVFSGTKETFVHARCGTTRFFSVGGTESFSYLLPASLPPGRYVYDIEAINDTGKPTKLVFGVSHVVFYVK